MGNRDWHWHWHWQQQQQKQQHQQQQKHQPQYQIFSTRATSTPAISATPSLRTASVKLAENLDSGSRRPRETQLTSAPHSLWMTAVGIAESQQSSRCGRRKRQCRLRSDQQRNLSAIFERVLQSRMFQVKGKIERTHCQCFLIR